MRSLRILPAVLQDIAEAADWYDKNGCKGLGERFIQTFYSRLNHIQSDGEMYRAVYLDFRKILIQPFPYTLFFRLYEDTWVISLVTHAARSPEWMKSRLQKRK